MRRLRHVSLLLLGALVVALLLHWSFRPNAVGPQSEMPSTGGPRHDAPQSWFARLTQRGIDIESATDERPGVVGIVLADGRPVPGATVFVTRYRQHDSLADEPCPCPDSPGARLLDDYCDCLEAETPLMELIVAGTPQPEPVAGDTTDADGRFAIVTLPSDAYVLTALHADAGAAVITGVRPSALSLEVQLRATIDLVVGVSNGDFDPVPGARVTLVDVTSGRLVRAQCDAEGEAEFAHLPDTTYYAIAEADGFFPGYELRDRGTDYVDVWLDPPRRVAGWVLDVNGGKAPGARVTLRGGTALLETVTDGAGRFEFTDVPPGEYYAIAELDGFLAGKLIDIDTDVDRQRLELQLDWVTGSELLGRVTDVNGAPVAGARVVVDTEEPWGREQAITDADGRYQLRPLPPGDFDVSVRVDGYVTFCGLIEVVEEESTLFDAVLEAGAPISGVLLAADGRALPGTLVWLTSDDELEDEEGWLSSVDDDEVVYRKILVDDFDYDFGEDGPEELPPLAEATTCDTHSAVTAANGTFRMSALPSGDYVVSIERDGGNTLVDTISLPGHDLVLRLPEEEDQQPPPELQDEAADDELLLTTDLSGGEVLAGALLTPDPPEAATGVTEGEEEEEDFFVVDLDELDEEGWADVAIWGEPESPRRFDF